MNFEFTENTVINIPLTYKGYRLEDGEKVRFRCCFKNYEGDFPYTLDMEEDNKGESGSDGKFTVTLDMGRYSISPGRYDFDLSLVLESGSLITLMSKNDNHINVIPIAEGLDKPNGEVFFGADFIVEEGQAEGFRCLWNYRKMNSGLIECWAHAEFELGKKPYDVGGGIRNAGGYIYCPVGLVTELTHVSVTPVHYWQTGASASIPGPDEKGRHRIMCSIFTPTTNFDDLKAKDIVDVYFEAKGRWK